MTRSRCCGLRLEAVAEESRRRGTVSPGARRRIAVRGWRPRGPRGRCFRTAGRGTGAVVRVGVLQEGVELLPRALGAVGPATPTCSRIARASQFIALGQDEQDREAADFAVAGLALRHHGEEGLELLERLLELLVVGGRVNQKKNGVGVDHCSSDGGAGVGIAEG